MNEFRRNKQISDKEINAFKEKEVNEILNQTSSLKKKHWFKRPMVIRGAFVLTTLLIILSIFILNQTEDKLDYTVTKLSYNEYLIESEVDNQKLNLYYKASVIQPGQRVAYNDTFEYYTPYSYASDDIARQYKVDFNVFKLSQYRYFLEVNFNNESTYIRINYHRHQITHWLLVDLEIDDLEKDISDIYELIEKYPPQFHKMNLTVPTYLRHPDIDLLEDSKAKRNYIQYVENNFYVPQDYNVDDSDIDEREDQIFKVLARQMITVNELGEFIDSEIYYNKYYGDASFTEYLPDWGSGKDFSFYIVGEDSPFGITGSRLAPDTQDIGGYYKVGFHDQKLYLYSYISLPYSNIDLSEAFYGEIEYTLTENFDYLEGANEFEFLNNHHGLVMPPLVISDDINSNNISEIYNYNFDGFYPIFETYTYRFYDINHTLIYEITI
ncbi:MAG: hypothetical protein ACLFPM_06195 [Candidatus Izemoplasmatales bacterium]